MRKFKVDDNTIWEETGYFRFHQAKSPRTLSYIVVEYKEIYRDKPGHNIVYGPPIYLHDLSSELIAFCKIYSEAQAIIMAKLPSPKGMIEI